MCPPKGSNSSRDVGINNGPNGGNVVMGGSSSHSIGMFSPTKIRTYDINAFKIENPNNNKTTFYVGTNGRVSITTDGMNPTDDVFTISSYPTTGSAITNFKVSNNGVTTIGKPQLASTPHSDAMLTVNGKMVSKSCFIRTADWADYVFAKDYKVPSLYDIEKYYVANKHLPEIPSEKEVLENGIDVAQMNKLLLKKIEEMTILMVKLQKEVDAIKTK